jgi:uncharacterized damage-inducible protein DinB
MVRPEPFLDSCKTMRAAAAQAVEDFPPGDRDFRPAGPPSRERIRDYAAELDDQSSAPQVAGVLRSSLDQWIPQLAARPDSFYSELVTRMDGSAVTRMEMLQFTREHELTHRSQLFLYLRLKGVVPPTTRRRMARK